MRSDYKVYRYDRLDAPVVTAGSAAVLIGAQNGLFPDMGYAVPGEMGGLWAGEKKVCDGFFLAVDDVPLTQADACEIHPVVTAFHYRMQKERLHVVRRQFIPDGVSGCVIELTIENLKNAPRMAEVSFTVRTDILTAAAARGEDGAELGRDVGEYDEQEQAFFARDSRNPWHAVWGAQTGCRVLQADLPQSVYGFGNTQGKGVNGRLFYRLRLAANEQATMRLYIAGGYPSRSKAEEALALLRGQAETMLEEKRARIEAMKALSDATLPDAALALRRMTDFCLPRLAQMSPDARIFCAKHITGHFFTFFFYPAMVAKSDPALRRKAFLDCIGPQKRFRSYCRISRHAPLMRRLVLPLLWLGRLP